MTKKVSKFFRIGVEGDTCDGRRISADDIQHMAASFDPRVYGCRINLEHLKGVLPDGAFRRYGDVMALKAEQVADDSVLAGKWALFAKISPTHDLVALNKTRQKIYTSMEIQPNFANSGKAYLVGLAITDDPASLGTDMLTFSANAQRSLFSTAMEVALEFEEATEPGPALFTRVKSLLTGKPSLDDARLDDIHAAVSAIAEHLHHTAADQDRKLDALDAALSDRLYQLEHTVAADRQAFDALTVKLSTTDNCYQQRRPLASGGSGASARVMTDC